MDEKLSGRLSNDGNLTGSLSTRNTVSGTLNNSVTITGTDDYNKLKEDTLPQINSVTLKRNKVSSELHVQHEMDVISYQDIDDILFG